MVNDAKFYIDGQWVEPITPNLFNVINPAVEDVAGQISLGSSADVDRAVTAARRAFATFSQTGKEERLAALGQNLDWPPAPNLTSPTTVLNQFSRVNCANLASSSETVPAMACSTICICA